MEPNHDILDMMIADRQQVIRAGILNANRSRPLSTIRRLTGRALIATGEYIRGEGRPDRIVDLAPRHIPLSVTRNP